MPQTQWLPFSLGTILDSPFLIKGGPPQLSSLHLPSHNPSCASACLESFNEVVRTERSLVTMVLLLSFYVTSDSILSLPRMSRKSLMETQMDHGKLL